MKPKLIRVTGALLIMLHFFAPPLLHAQDAAFLEWTAMNLSNTSYNDDQETAPIALDSFLATLEKKYAISFAYDGNLIKDKKVSVKEQEEKSLDTILETALKPLNLKYKKINEKHYIIQKVAEQQVDKIGASNNDENVNKPNAPAMLTSAGAKITPIIMQQTITGRVTDGDSGDGLPGVSILAKGTTTGTVTDMNGDYRLTVADDITTLVFSSIGYTTEEVEIGNRSTINIQMMPDIQSLSEVVVVGYGTQKKSDVTGAIGMVSSEELLKAPINNAIQGLQGKVAGVNVFLNSGSPTSSPRVLIRGLGTINSGSSPLYVVDGVVMEDIQFLNPNDIQSMEVLKDASATAIYGSRGANGVIMVTTKRGANKEGVIVGYDGYVSVGTLRKKMDLLNAQEWLDVVRIGMENAPKYRPDTEANFTANDPRLFDSNGNPLYDTDWQEEATRTAVSHNHQFSIRQKSEKSSYGAFLNYSRMEGIMLNNYMDRFYGKIAYEGNPKDWFTFGFNLLANYTEENEFDEGGGYQMPRRTMIEMPPIFPVKFPDGTWSNSQMISDAYNLEAMANPVHVLETQDRLRKRTQLFGNTYFTFHLADGLDLRTQIGFDKHDRLFQEYSPTDLINISDPLGTAYQGNERVLYWQQETFLNYNKEFGAHRLNGVLGLSWQERIEEGFGITTRGFADDFFRYNNLGAASQPDAPSSYYTKWAMNSYFLRGSYTYMDKYMLTLTGRVDGSSRFGADNKYGFFPSIGAGWMVSEEDFLENSSVISQLKLRSSYGITGNTEIDTYRSLATVYTGTLLLNGQRASQSYVNRLANPSLEWEKTHQFDVGFNLALFDYKIGLEFDYYYKLTTDLLLNRPLPQTTGFSGVYDNIGEVSNRGVEVMLNTTNIENNKFSWNTTLNFNYNENRIEKLGANDEDIFPGPNWVSGSQTILRVGEPLASFWGYERLGTWNTDEADEAEAVGAVPGEAKRSAEQKIIGNGLPKWTGSLINNFTYGNFDLSIDLQFVYDVDIMQQYYHSTEDRSGIANGLRTILTEGWTPDNQNTMVQEIRNQAYAGQNSQVDSRWIADGSYLRGNLITLGYNIDNSMTERLNIGNFRVYASVQNAFVLHSDEFQGLDPEATSWGGNQWGQNIFFFQYPRPRTYTVGVNVQF
ncbi:SusC/RagA family TonB-linked outer membrane protein [Porifericola rhodea]|uniref:SusC/RagA family TonB-linked outer membrane protein n=1 Tax=Porifericola rhodea TaxID=930972 RepID=UPI002666114B|nr:SusC/RagA family TonB-linked outer membrane protein [Porifericola rhodea]WKN30361.1 SusC/RagA family TonB-linked outer membrane protein [Porifericola rhodea]